MGNSTYHFSEHFLKYVELTILFKPADFGPKSESWFLGIRLFRNHEAEI